MRVHGNFLRGTIDNNPLADDGTTLTSDELADVPVIASPDYMPIVLDPLGDDGDPEIAYITAHSDGSVNATISRGEEGASAGREHASGTRWTNGPLVADLETEWLTATPPTITDIGTGTPITSMGTDGEVILEWQKVGSMFRGFIYISFDDDANYTGMNAFAIRGTEFPYTPRATIPTSLGGGQHYTNPGSFGYISINGVAYGAAPSFANVGLAAPSMVFVPFSDPGGGALDNLWHPTNPAAMAGVPITYQGGFSFRIAEAEL